MLARFNAFTREAFGDLTATGRFWMWVGLIALACSMGMAFDYGRQVSIKHGLVMAVLSLATAFIFEEAYKHWRNGLPAVAVILSIVAIPLFWQETKSHIAYTAGYRGINVETATLQQTKYEDKRNDIDEAKASLAFYERRLKSLQESNPWAGSVSADQLRAKLTSANLAISLEEQRGGCKAKCFALTKERDEMASRIAAIEELNKTAAMIDATRAALDKSREKAAAVEHKPSIVAHQNDTLNRIAALVSTGGMDASPLLKEVVEQENTIGLALMPVILPALGFFLMGLHRRTRHEFEPSQSSLMPAPLHYSGQTGIARVA